MRISAILTSVLAMATAATAANATLVTSIRVSNSLPDYLQVAELVATQAGTGIDVALGGIATPSSVYAPGFSTADKAIDGNTDGNYYDGSIFHSAGSGGGEFLLVTFAQAYDLSSFTLYGRTDCCSARDFYDYQLFNGSDIVGRGSVNSSGSTHSATVTLPTGAVPEPASWAMMLSGFGMIGGAMRNRRKTAVSFG